MKSDRTDTSTSAAEAPSAPVLLDTKPARGQRRIWPWIVGLVILAVVVFLLVRGGSKEAAATAKAGKGPPALFRFPRSRLASGTSTST